MNPNNSPWNQYNYPPPNRPPFYGGGRSPHMFSSPPMDSYNSFRSPHDHHRGRYRGSPYSPSPRGRAFSSPVDRFRMNSQGSAHSSPDAHYRGRFPTPNMSLNHGSFSNSPKHFNQPDSGHRGHKYYRPEMVVDPWENLPAIAISSVQQDPTKNLGSSAHGSAVASGMCRK